MASEGSQPEPRGDCLTEHPPLAFSKKPASIAVMPDELINGIDVAEFLPLAHSIAISFARSGAPDADELCSIAQSALMRAAQGYSPSKGAFSPYAGTVVRNAMLSEIRRRKGTGTQVTIDVLDFDPKAVASEAKAIFASNPNEEAANKDRRELLEKMQSLLDPRDQKAIQLLAEGASLSEIGKSLGVSKTMAHKIVNSALARMREELRARRINDRMLFSQAPHREDRLDYSPPKRELPKLAFNFDEWAQSVRAGTARRSWLARLWG